MKYAVIDKHEGKRVSTHGSYMLARKRLAKLHNGQEYATASMDRYAIIPADAEAERIEAKLLAEVR